MVTPIPRIYIRQIADRLGYRSIRSAYRWCRNNGVTIICDTGCRTKYVLLAEFNRAWNRQAHAHLLMALWCESEETISRQVATVPEIVLQGTKRLQPSDKSVRTVDKKVRGFHETRFITLLESALATPE